MEQEKTRTIAFLCPSCRQLVILDRTPFQLLAGHSHLPCPCGKSALELEPLGDRVEAEVPCAYCGKSHRVSCSAHDLLKRRAMAFTCAASGLPCCIAGEEEAVYAAARRMERTADQLDAAPEGERGSFLNEVIMHEVLSELKDIAARGGVSCTCGSREWTMKVDHSAVQLRCARCGGVLRIPAACDDDLEDLCCRPTLTIRGRA